jgi:hypothetical protein
MTMRQGNVAKMFYINLQQTLVSRASLIRVEVVVKLAYPRGLESGCLKSMVYTWVCSRCMVRFFQ